jgi:hypothetical protein
LRGRDDRPPEKGNDYGTSNVSVLVAL